MTFNRTLKSGALSGATPSEILNRIKKFFPIFGITRLSNITGLDRVGVPVVAAIRPNSRSLATSQGKGLSLDIAKVSAAMESIENYHAENIYKEVIHVSYEDILYRENVIDITGVARKYSQPLSFSERMLWLRGTDLLNQKEIWVPYNLISTDFTNVSQDSALIPDSNGLSSGRTHIESILHGLYEVIERDALSIYFHDPDAFRNKKIDLQTINSAESIELLTKLSLANVNAAVWDITTDIGVPTYICKLIDAGDDWEVSARTSYGSGGHLNKSIAIQRAIIEAIQSRVTFIAGARDDQPAEKYNHSYSKLNLEKWRKDIATTPNYSFSCQDTHRNQSYEEDLNLLIQKMENCGLRQIAYINLTKPEFDIPVSKIIVPHLEGISHSHDRAIGNRIKGELTC